LTIGWEEFNISLYVTFAVCWHDSYLNIRDRTNLIIYGGSITENGYVKRVWLEYRADAGGGGNWTVLIGVFDLGGIFLGQMFLGRPCEYGVCSPVGVYSINLTPEHYYFGTANVYEV